MGESHTHTRTREAADCLRHLRTIGVIPDDDGMIIISEHFPAGIKRAVWMLCDHDDRFDWKYGEDVQ
jgi:hypothetical protein